MGIEVEKYNLPDIELLEINNAESHIFWIPERYYAVLGVSNKAELSLIEENIIEDKIKVLKRPSGGEAVILSPKTLVISCKGDCEKLSSPKNFFYHTNKKIIDALSLLGVKELYQKGISDIAIKDKKILGSSSYRNKTLIFYQAVLNISEDTEIFSKYLQHPQKEPDYRKGRNHSSFVTSLKKEGYLFDHNTIIEALSSVFK